MKTTSPSDIPVLIPAAGRSSRMRGEDKLMRHVDGVPLLQRQIARAAEATCGPVIVLLPSGPHDRYGCLTGSRAVSVSVPDASDGMSASLRRGVQALPPATRAAMILLPDLPDITADDIRKMLASAETGDTTLMWCAMTEDDQPGHPVVLGSDLFDDLLKISGDNGARELRRRAAERNALRCIRLGGRRARLDLDTPEDWQAWEATRK
ncbi:nucleotidyltransferase family protein [uncultured Roseobacter sp.]|uniref:nucleotidyltransferase family protein n=1 Tax=uncultured Roseobacter sp. TaxID=114847 RepID=UPI00262444C0|nr:nucleotidyltransferase family protein [uncultured Roseobacter sp.]